MVMIVIGLIVGVMAAYFAPVFIPPAATEYVAIALLASLDSVFGGISAHMNSNFKLGIFVSGFFGNAAMAVGFVYVGKLLGFDLVIPCAVVLGIRIFRNFAIMRRQFLRKFNKDTEKIL